METVISRKMWRTLEPYHALVYFAPEPNERYEELGVMGFDGYFASRSAPMGAVAAEVVIATFFNFNPTLVHAAILRSWDAAHPEGLLDARLAGIDAALRRTVGDELAGPQVARAAELARAATEGCTVAGRALYAGHARLPWPEEPHLALWHALTLLREFRGDGHVACLVGAGLGPVDSLVLHAASGEVSRAALQGTRQWDDEAWDASVAALGARGLVDASGDFTDAGRQFRQDIEDRTDALALAPWEALGEDRCDELRGLVRPFSKAIVAGGDFGPR